MEILNNFSVLFITYRLFFTLIEGVIGTTLFVTLFDISTNWKRKTLYIVSSSLITIINNFLIPTPINVFINYGLFFLLIIIIFKVGSFKALFSIFLPITMFGIISTLILNPYLYMLQITTDELSNNLLYNTGYLLCLYLISCILIVIIKRTDFKLTIFEDITKRSKSFVLANIIFGLVALIVQACITFYYINILPLIITLASFISLLAYFIISIYSFTRILRLDVTTQKLQSAEEYNNTLKYLYDNVSCFKHDFDNIISTIGGYIVTDDMKGLVKYYNELETDCEKVNSLYLINPGTLNNPGIYNLVAGKYKIADTNGIKMNMSFALDLNNLHMKIYEFGRILGILLDNAIQASQECDEKIINLVFRDDVKNHRQLIIIENTYKNKNINVEKIFEKNFSEKKNHSGLGLWEVRKIIKKHKNLNLYTSNNEKYFSQQLEIYYN